MWQAPEQEESAINHTRPRKNSKSCGRLRGAERAGGEQDARTTRQEGAITGMADYSHRAVELTGVYPFVCGAGAISAGRESVSDVDTIEELG